MEKCPYCGSSNFQKLDPPNGDTFFLMSADRNNLTKNTLDGAYINAFGCYDCKGIKLTTDFLGMS